MLYYYKCILNLGDCEVVTDKN